MELCRLIYCRLKEKCSRKTSDMYNEEVNSSYSLPDIREINCRRFLLHFYFYFVLFIYLFLLNCIDSTVGSPKAD